MNNHIQTLVTEISKLNNDELNLIVEAIKLRRQFITKTMARAIRPGTTVEFDAKTRGIIRGTVTKVNTKNIVVQQENTLTSWRVPANMLTVVSIRQT
jgi:phosphoserine aminotransferase